MHARLINEIAFLLCAYEYMRPITSHAFKFMHYPSAKPFRI